MCGRFIHWQKGPFSIQNISLIVCLILDQSVSTSWRPTRACLTYFQQIARVFTNLSVRDSVRCKGDAHVALRVAVLLILMAYMHMNLRAPNQHNSRAWNYSVYSDNYESFRELPFVSITDDDHNMSVTPPLCLPLSLWHTQTERNRGALGRNMIWNAMRLKDK